MIEDRPTIAVSAPVGGWPSPWPNVAELARTLPGDKWTLIGGLMTQLHTVHRGLGVTRATNDVDIVLHIETARGLPNATATALESLGYELRTSADPREKVAHRWVRGDQKIDVVSSTDTIDVVAADHAAPVVRERMRGRVMVEIPGGTQALRRTVNARLEIVPGEPTTISVPRPFGAVVLKVAAYLADPRDRDRHLFDAAALLACIEDPFAEREQFAGSDGKRLRRLARALPTGHPAWLALTGADRDEAQAALDVLAAGLD